MSSGTRVNMGIVSRALGGLMQRIVGAGSVGTQEGQAAINRRIARLGLSARQQVLNSLWSWYRCERYAGRRLDWTGKENLDPIAHESVSTAGFLPPGFYDAGESLPIKFRKPTAPYALPRVIVDRFTGLLFSLRHSPHIRIEGDPDSEDFVNTLAEEARLWPAMIQARQYGGAMGTFCVGFQFVNGKPVVEVHDPRWVKPEFEDRFALRLKSIDKRYIYTVDEWDEQAGVYREVDYWYRRIIDQQKDVLYKPVKVEHGDEPVWEELVEKEVVHGLGFCPVRWVQNLPVQDDIDGDPDCHGVYEFVEAMDALLAQAIKGTLANSDPTVILTTKAPMADVKKGSENAIKLPDGDAKYMEMSGSGTKLALEEINLLRERALEVAQCVLDQADSVMKTATEIERAYSSMLSKADILREQYGEKGVKPLLDDMLQAARKLDQPRVNAEGQMERQTLQLPPKLVHDEDGNVTGTAPRKLGPGGHMQLQWPVYFEPTLADAQAATQAAGLAKTNGLLDDEHAVKFTAEYFKVEDVAAMQRKIKREAAAQQEQMNAAMMGGMGGGGGEGY